MRNILFILMLFGLSGCSENYYELSSLKHYTVNFNDLPEDIIMYLKNPTDYQNDIQTMLLELPKGKEKNYKLETVDTWLGPWVAYEKLINIKNDVYYKINQGTPSPYILFENKLYIPDRFNIFTTVNDLNKVEFTCYILK